MYCRYSKSSTSGTLCWCSTCNAQAQSACCAWFTALAVHDQLNHYSIVIFIWKKPVFIKHTVIVQYKSGTLISSCLASKKLEDLYSRFNLYGLDQAQMSFVTTKLTDNCKDTLEGIPFYWFVFYPYPFYLINLANTFYI